MVLGAAARHHVQHEGGRNPQQSYTNVSDFQVTGGSFSKALDATQGLGRFFGTAVVPDGVDINVLGKVAAEVGGIAEPGMETGSLAKGGATLAALVEEEWDQAVARGAPRAPISPGPDFHFDFVAVAPEPSGLLVVGLAAVVLGRRRVR